MPNVSRVLTFKLGGKAALPAVSWKPTVVFNPPKLTASPDTLRLGFATYQDVCMGCHGLNAVSGLLIPDLRGSAYLWDEKGWDAVVRGGQLKDRGMASFADNISAEQSEAVRAYIIQQAQRGKALL
jgi:mono/diheme cytochrome c family protein